MSLLFSSLMAMGRGNEKALNRPYADLKAVHFGFSVGTVIQDLGITNNGYVTEDGKQWVAEVPDWSPGFTVGVLADLRLGNYFNLRFAPGMQFANKVVKFRNTMAAEGEEYESQNVKSTFVVVPVELKYSALRYKNVRPYLLGGVMGIIDVSKRRSEQYQFKTLDGMLSIGFGCDIYLPFFKFCPELKFCFGLSNILKKNRPDLEDNPPMMDFTRSVDRVVNNMVVLTFYFE